jgi:hypothetical protein
MKTAKATALAAILVSLPSLAFAQSTAPGGAVIAPSPYYGYSASPYYGYYAYAPAYRGYYNYAYAPTYRGHYNYMPGYYYGWQRW